MIGSATIWTVVVFFALSGTVFGQNRDDFGFIGSGRPDAPMFVPSKIGYVPPLARAVLRNNRELVNKALVDGAKVDEPIRGKDQSRAGYTPLILAAALSEPDIAHVSLSTAQE